DHQRLVLQRSDESVKDLKKKTSQKSIIAHFQYLFEQCSSAFNQHRTFQRARSLALGLLCSLGRCTVTGMLTASGNQFKDWSAAYRLFKGSRMNLKDIFGVIRKQVVLLNESDISMRTWTIPYCERQGRKYMVQVGYVIH